MVLKDLKLPKNWMGQAMLTLGHAKGSLGSLVSPQLCLASFPALSLKRGEEERGGEPWNEAI